MKSIFKITAIIIIGIILGLIIIEWQNSHTYYSGNYCGVEVYTLPPTSLELEVVEKVNQKYSENFEFVSTDFMWGVIIDPTLKMEESKLIEIENAINDLEEHTLYLRSEILNNEIEVKMIKGENNEWVITDNYLDVKYENDLVTFFKEGFEKCLGYPVYQDIVPNIANQFEVIGVETDKNASFETYLKNADKCFEFRIVTFCENGLSDEEKLEIKENFRNYFYDNGIDFQVYIWIVTEEANFGRWDKIPVEKRDDVDIIYVTSLPSKGSFSFSGRLY